MTRMNAKGEAALPSRMPVGIVVERRMTGNPWQPESWRTVDVVPGAASGEVWRRIAAGENWERLYAGGLTIELFPGETAGYRETLSSRQPVVFVVLRKNEGEKGVRPLLATVCPYEAQCYLDSGEEIVDGVPMSPPILAWVGAFVERNHVERPFVKRRRQAKRREGEDSFRPFRGSGGQ